VIRTLTSEEKKKTETAEEWERDEKAEHIPAAAGLNRFFWDLRYEPAVKIPGAVYDSGNDPVSPLALPGKYSVRLTAGGKSSTEPLELSMDPRVKTSADDLRQQFDFILKMRNRQDEMNRAILGIRDSRNQLKALEKRLAGNDGATSIVTSSSDIRKKITAIEEELIQVNATASEDEANYPTKLNSKLSYLNVVSDSADTAPTSAEQAVFAELDKQLESQLEKWREVLTKDLPALNDAMQKNNIPLIAPAVEAKH
jgi:hypothetical protein